MPKCKSISKTKKMLCITSLKTSVVVYDRDIRAPKADGNHSERYSNPRPVKAQVETRGKGVDVFSDISQDYVTVSHLITMRFMQNITSQNWVQFGGKNYDVLKAENIDEESRYLRLYCSLSGSTSKAGAL